MRLVRRSGRIWPMVVPLTLLKVVVVKWILGRNVWPTELSEGKNKFWSLDWPLVVPFEVRTHITWAKDRAWGLTVHCSQAKRITCCRLWSLCPRPPPNIMDMRVEHTMKPTSKDIVHSECYNPSSQKNGYSKRTNFNNSACCSVRGMLPTKAVWFNYHSPCFLRARAPTDADSSMWISPIWAGAIFLGYRHSGSSCTHPTAILWLNIHPAPSLTFFFLLYNFNSKSRTA